MSTTTGSEQFEVHWKPRDGGELKNQPHAEYPDGIDLDESGGARVTCTIELPYPAQPAETMGIHMARCRLCGLTAACTVTGRHDDPRTLKVPCRDVKQIWELPEDPGVRKRAHPISGVITQTTKVG